MDIHWLCIVCMAYYINMYEVINICMLTVAVYDMLGSKFVDSVLI